MHGAVTAGPFVRHDGDKVRLGCVVDKRRLVWLDPEAEKPLWSYEMLGVSGEPLPILGQPQVEEGVVVVTVLEDKAGMLIGVDAKTGKQVGERYTWPGSVAPLTKPVGFDANLLFVPLSDGTVILLSRDKFRAN